MECRKPIHSTSTGFSATVFERDGQRYLTIRGTQPTDVLDLIDNREALYAQINAIQVSDLFVQTAGVVSIEQTLALRDAATADTIDCYVLAA
jgi:hypothetical protein